MIKELNYESKMKIVRKITEGQSKKMILWEFKISKETLDKILKEFNINVRTGDLISYCSKLEKKK